MMRHIVRLVLPVAALILIVGFLPVLPTDIGRTNQFAQLIDVGEQAAGGGLTAGSSALQDRQDALRAGTGTVVGGTTFGGTLDTETGPIYYQIIPSQGTTGTTQPAAGSTTSAGSTTTGGSTTGTTSSTGGTGTTTKTFQPAINPGSFEMYGSANQIIQQQWQQQQTQIISAQSLAGFAPSTLGEAFDLSDCIEACKEVEVSAANECQQKSAKEDLLKSCLDAARNTEIECEKRCREKAKNSSSATTAGGAASTAGGGTTTGSVASTAGGLQVWIPAQSNVVTINSSENAASPSTPVVLLPGTANVSLTQLPGYVPVRVAPVTVQASKVATIAKDAGVAAPQVEKAGDLLDAIAVNAANDILGQTRVQTTGGAIVIPTAKTTALSVIGKGVSETVAGFGNSITSVFSNIGGFFTNLLGGGISVETGTSGGQNTNLPTSGNATAGTECNANACSGPCTAPSGLAGVCTAGAPQKKVCVKADDTGCIEYADPEKKDQTGTVVSVPTCVCQETVPPPPTSTPPLGPVCADPRGEQKVPLNADATASADATIKLKSSGPRTTFVPNCIKSTNADDPQNPEYCQQYSGVRAVATSDLVSVAAFTSNAPTAPTPPPANATQAQKDAYEAAKQKYEEDKLKGNVGEVKQRSDADIQKDFLNQLASVLQNGSALSQENPDVANLLSADSAAVGTAMGDLAAAINKKPIPACSGAGATSHIECPATETRDGITINCPTPCGVYSATPDGDPSVTKDDPKMTITGYDTGSGDNKVSHKGSPSAKDITQGQITSVNVKLTQVFHIKQNMKFGTKCGGGGAKINVPTPTPPPDSNPNPPPSGGGGGGGGVASGGGPEVAKPASSTPPAPEPSSTSSGNNPPSSGGNNNNGGFFDGIWKKIQDILNILKNLGTNPPPGGTEVEPPIVEPPIDDGELPPPPDDRTPPPSAPELTGPTTNALLKCQPRSAAVIALLESREKEKAANDTSYVPQKVSKCTGGSDCGNGQACGETPSGGCACLNKAATPPPANVPAAPAPKPDDTKTGTPPPPPTSTTPVPSSTEVVKQKPFDFETWKTSEETCDKYSAANIKAAVAAYLTATANPFGGSEEQCRSLPANAPTWEKKIYPWAHPACSAPGAKATACAATDNKCTAGKCVLDPKGAGCGCSAGATTGGADGKTVAPPPPSSTPSSTPPTTQPTVTPPVVKPLNNCQLTNGTVGFDVPTTGANSGVLTFTDLAGNTTVVMNYEAFKGLTEGARANVLTNAKTADGKSVADAANERAKSVCGANKCSAGGSSCTFDQTRSSLTNRCYCASGSTTVAPPTVPPPTPPIVAPTKPTPAPPPASSPTACTYTYQVDVHFATDGRCGNCESLLQNDHSGTSLRAALQQGTNAGAQGRVTTVLHDARPGNDWPNTMPDGSQNTCGTMPLVIVKRIGNPASCGTQFRSICGATSASQINNTISGSW